MNKKDAFILFGGLRATRFPNLWKVIKNNYLVLLVIDEPNQKVEDYFRKNKNNLSNPISCIDEVATISKNNKCEILEKVNNWSNKYAIKGVYNTGEEFVESASMAANLLHLPSPGLCAARVCRNKFLQRMYFTKYSPKFKCILPHNRNKNHIISKDMFPAVLKPTSRSSSSGVELVNNIAEFSSYINNYPSDEILLLEKRITGREYSVETLCQDHKIIFANITEKHTNETCSKYFVEMSHTVPATNLSNEERNKVLLANADVLKTMKFENGISHGEYRIGDDGKIYLMEIAARNPGDAVFQLYQLATGFEIEKAVIDIALGNKATYYQPRRYAKQVYIPHEYGIFNGIDVQINHGVKLSIIPEQVIRNVYDGSKEHAKPKLYEITSIKNLGDRLGQIKDSLDRSVYLIIDAKSAESLQDFENKMTGSINLLVSNEHPGEDNVS